ncbi:MAG: hypothetical protein SFW07_04915 [Gammaproteobacteria bacterium]|nr:hypothetical protein [Gammaproteobacteria bacterium]
MFEPQDQDRYTLTSEQYDAIELDGYPTASRRRRSRLGRTFWHGIYQGVFAGFLWLARLANNLVRYYMASLSIPVEIANFIITVKKIVQREKPAVIIAVLSVLLLLLINTMVLVDLVRFGVIASGPLAAIAGAGPFIFTGALAILGFMNALRAWGTAKEVLQASRNGTLTYLHKVRLGSQIVKTLGLFALSGLIAPFMFATAANPVGALIFAAVLTTVLATMVVVKIWKTIQENRAWDKTMKDLDDAHEDPYEVLGVDRDELQKYAEAKNTRSFLTKIKIILGLEEKKLGPSEYVKERLEAKIKEHGAKQKLAHCAELIRKSRGREIYDEHMHERTVKVLQKNGIMNAYEFLGTTAAEIEAEVAKDPKPGIFAKAFGLASESPTAKAFLKDKYESFEGDAEKKKFAEHVYRMLSTRKGRESYQKYIANQTKNSVPKRTMLAHEPKKSIGRGRSSSQESLLGWTHGNGSPRSGRDVSPTQFQSSVRLV